MLLTGERRGMDFFGPPICAPSSRICQRAVVGSERKKRVFIGACSSRPPAGGRRRLSEARLRHIRPPFSRARHPYPLSLSCPFHALLLFHKRGAAPHKVQGRKGGWGGAIEWIHLPREGGGGDLPPSSIPPVEIGWGVGNRGGRSSRSDLHKTTRKGGKYLFPFCLGFNSLEMTPPHPTTNRLLSVAVYTPTD